MPPIIVTQSFDAPLEKVWNALSDEAALKKWYFPVEAYDFKIGKTFTFYESADSHNYFHRCTFVNIIPNQRIEYTWEHPRQSNGSSVVKWEFAAEGDKTTITLTHTGTENFSDGGAAFAPANYEMGWNAIVKGMLRNYLYGIKKLEFNVDIHAPAAKVWVLMWDKQGYSDWTAPFCAGSYYEGKIAQGNRVHLLSPSGEGMYSDIFFYKENEVLVFKHIGLMKDKKEVPLDPETEKWTGCFETYRLTEKNGITTLKAEVDTLAQYVEYMENSFPAALAELKRLSEQ